MKNVTGIVVETGAGKEQRPLGAVRGGGALVSKEPAVEPAPVSATTPNSTPGRLLVPVSLVKLVKRDTRVGDLIAVLEEKLKNLLAEERRRSIALNLVTNQIADISSLMIQLRSRRKEARVTE